MGNAQAELNIVEGPQVVPEIAAELAIEKLWDPIPQTKLRLKRVIDFLGAAFFLIVTAPIMAVIALVVKLSSPGPVLYPAIRVGKNGGLFICYKFRTMVRNADSMKKHLLHLNERGDILFKISNDPRLAPMGRFLRKYSLDELPQLLNVLRGEMSLVGPRPPLVEEYKKYSRQQKRRMLVLPGLTGLWQIRGRQDPSFENYMALDLQYIDNWDLLLDIKILLKTVPAVFKGTGQ